MNNIKNLRNLKSITQKDLAKMLGLNQASVCRWEQDKTLPETKHLLKMSEILDASIDYILGKSKYYYPEDLGKDGVYTTEERQLVEAYRKLSPELQRTIQDTLNTFVNSVEQK